MRSYELTTGRTFGVTFDHGDDFFPTLADFCRQNSVKHGYIPMFIAGFAEAEIVGACEKLENPEAPVWSKVHLTGVEAMGCGGTLAYDAETDTVLPHIHTSLGEKAQSATGQRPDSCRNAAALVAACTACDPNGWVLDDDDTGPMRRCTHEGVTSSATATIAGGPR
ncbi:hypothetical protein SALBM217S_08671 [Streptomyces griseoloalbus]